MSINLADSTFQPKLPHLSAQDRVGRLAAKIPQASRVFARHRIDYCCGGNLSLEDACSSADVDVMQVIDEINGEWQRDHSAQPADGRTIEELIVHIQTVYHKPLREELPRLRAMAEKVARVHEDRDGERLAALAEAVGKLDEELNAHMDKEDEVLFPLLIEGQNTMARMPITMMQHEHDDHGVLLRGIRMLTHDFRVPGDACMTWRALWKSLEELEQSLHEHIHLENNVLFQKALMS